jgi:hypothetical protein
MNRWFKKNLYSILNKIDDQYKDSYIKLIFIYYLLNYKLYSIISNISVDEFKGNWSEDKNQEVISLYTEFKYYTILKNKIFKDSIDEWEWMNSDEDKKVELTSFEWKLEIILDNEDFLHKFNMIDSSDINL